MKKFFRVFFGNGLFFDLPNENDIPLPQFIANVLMIGYVMNDAFCVPWANINYIVVAQTENGSVVPFKPHTVN